MQALTQSGAERGVTRSRKKKTGRQQRIRRRVAKALGDRALDVKEVESATGSNPPFASPSNHTAGPRPRLEELSRKP